MRLLPKVRAKLTGVLLEKTWNGLSSNFNRQYVWTDGTDIYYSSGTTQYVLDKATSTWSVKTWSGLTSFDGQYIWTDGTDIYYSFGTTQYVLDKATSKWSRKTWSGLTSFYRSDVWTDGTDIYYSYGSNHYVLDKATSTWSAKTWNGLTSFGGSSVWSDGTDIYYSLNTNQYVLDKETGTWSTKTWNGLTDFNGIYIWTDGTDIYYSNGTTQYVLDKETSTWSAKTWTGLTSFNGRYVWTDGTDIYYSNGTNQCIFTKRIILREYTFLNSRGLTKLVGIIKSAIAGKVDKVTGKGLSTNDFTDALKSKLDGIEFMSHNIPRYVNGVLGKDITSYYQDGTLYKRLNGTDGFSFCEDIYVGDYFLMSRAITCPDSYQGTVGSDWVTIAGIDTLMGNGDSNPVNYHHLIMVPGKGEAGSQHFGRHAMNDTDTTAGGYVGSKMHADVLGAAVSAGSTASGATINQQLYAEFGSHLKTTRELVSNAINATGYNRFGSATGCASGWKWISVQAILMSEIEAYGSIVWSNTGYDTGNANRQLPLFAFSKQAQSNRSAYWWFKDIASAAFFCGANYDGYAGFYYASLAATYVRPRFILAA